MIFYFSGTGNSLYIAQKLKEKIGGDIISIKDAYKNEEYEYTVSNDELVGIVYPVYFYTSAPIVQDFLSKLKLKNKTSVFLVANCGGSSGKANEIIENILNKNGLNVSSKFNVLMPDNYILMSDVKSESQNETILNNADDEIDYILNKLDMNEFGDFNKHKGPLASVLSPVAGFMYKHMNKTKKFTIQKEECIGCSKCRAICPSNAIEMNKCKPVWVKDRCVQCLACINRCPQHCIDYGKSTINRGRYVNPRVEFDDFNG